MTNAWPTLRVAHKDGEFHALWPGELSTPFKRSGYEIQEFVPAPPEPQGDAVEEETLQQFASRIRGLVEGEDRGDEVVIENIMGAVEEVQRAASIQRPPPPPDPQGDLPALHKADVHKALDALLDAVARKARPTSDLAERLLGDEVVERLAERYYGRMPFDESHRDEEREATVAMKKALKLAREDITAIQAVLRKDRDA
jgi:hypothetical protein